MLSAVDVVVCWGCFLMFFISALISYINNVIIFCTLTVMPYVLFIVVCRSGRLAGKDAGTDFQVWGLAGRSGGQPGSRHAMEPAV